MKVSWKTLSNFEYHRILEELASLCLCPATQERARNLLPLSPDILPSHLEEVKETQDLIKFDGDIPLGAFPDLRPVFQVLHVVGTCLSLEEAIKIHRLLLLLQEMHHFLRERKVEQKYPLISSRYFQRIRDFGPLLRRAEEIFSRDGQILDTASEKLWQIRRSKEGLQGKIEETLHRMLQDPRFIRYLQEPLFTVRKGRYVVPVKVQFRETVKGFVVDYSASGSTVFIEPWSIAQLWNELEILESLEKEEIERILASFTEFVRPHTQELLETFECLVEVDLLRAKVKLGEKWRGEVPQVGGEKLSIYEGRHPLLGGRAVPFDLEVPRDKNTVIVSGPNGGGKTVLIKTIALLVVITFCGIPVPLKKSSSIPLYDYLFVDIGDHQDIESNLSTFTSRMISLSEALKETTQESLFLIDELGAGTDPQEGAALGMAVLEYLKERGTTCIATTHLSALRNYALQREGTMAASLSFDAETFQPTYHLVVGEVGASFGIKIAEKVGIPQEVVRAAFGFLRSEEVELNELLLSLSRERERFERLVLQFEEKLAGVERERKELEALRKSLEEERRYVLKTFRKEMEAYLKEKKEEIARLVGELRKVRELDEEKYRALQAVIAREEQGIRSLGEEPKKEVESFRVGDAVFVEPLGSGIVLEVDAKRKEVLVEVGERRVRVAPERLRKEKREVLSPPLSTPVVTYAPEKRTTNEISIRALRAEEALEVLEKYLDRVILAGFTTVYVIHGKGEGKLRKVTHEFLRNHPYVQDFRLGRPEEGGVGVTVVTLRS